MVILGLCAKIFFFRIIDVSMASFRTVIMVKGKSLLASIIALIEGLIWFLVVREALSFEANSFAETLYIALAYAGGFSMGTFVGTKIAEKFVDSLVQVQVVASSKDDSIVKAIQDAGYATTVILSEATSFSGEKYMFFSEIKHSKLQEFKDLVYSLDSKAFIMVSETMHVFNGFIKK